MKWYFIARLAVLLVTLAVALTLTFTTSGMFPVHLTVAVVFALRIESEIRRAISRRRTSL